MKLRILIAIIILTITLPVAFSKTCIDENGDPYLADSEDSCWKSLEFTTCRDPDQLNYYIPSLVEDHSHADKKDTLEFSRVYDVCDSSGEYVYEHYCEGGLRKTVKHRCPIDCRSGACIYNGTSYQIYTYDNNYVNSYANFLGEKDGKIYFLNYPYSDEAITQMIHILDKNNDTFSSFAISLSKDSRLSGGMIDQDGNFLAFGGSYEGGGYTVRSSDGLNWSAPKYLNFDERTDSFLDLTQDSYGCYYLLFYREKKTPNLIDMDSLFVAKSCDLVNWNLSEIISETLFSPEIFWDFSSNKLVVISMKYFHPTISEIIHFTSDDGVSWSEPEVLLENALGSFARCEGEELKLLPNILLFPMAPISSGKDNIVLLEGQPSLLTFYKGGVWSPFRSLMAPLNDVQDLLLSDNSDLYILDLISQNETSKLILRHINLEEETSYWNYSLRDYIDPSFNLTITSESCTLESKEEVDEVVFNSTQCNEIDGGKNPTIPGLVWQYGVKSEDECLFGKYVYEYFCEDGEKKHDTIYCKDGCQNGACASK
ncbi:hypothetical protein HN419_03755 [Candidatus Woesearchaeota archaeon]|jgi:hypothetical protein|nr:hypothetical protein [Candidatus Woesearchaeota archaeon]MBT3538008.1 hypothetical protein [Candidatus Woesearchaeota archaeon]MBT4698099.1 hypothetical protein [Candidatus Woesearchaeota archaeon]MBT4717083.1 hypothetical protein [Candidatus Woesearchaeota archaeon]MBT7105677.1 hypothetical protein [Candidatus Woesearchaeota archaeon]